MAAPGTTRSRREDDIKRRNLPLECRLTAKTTGIRRKYLI